MQRPLSILLGIVFCVLTLAPGVVAGDETAARSSSESAIAEVPAFAPNTDLYFTAARCDEAVRIDGRLDDPAWRSAARLGNFSEIEPGDNVRPPVETETWVAYDTDNLYVGFKCYDNDPSAIRATITDRDDIFGDDFIGIIIDTFRDQQNGYEFFVNPYGIQGDLRRVNNNEDASYDAVWESAGRITDDGWTAEMAIPFRSIRFPDAQVQEWGMHVIRIRPRDSREQHSWAPIRRGEPCMICVAGTMGGLEDINQGRNLEVLPYVLGSQSSALEGENHDEFDWRADNAQGQAGFGVKYGITSNYTADLTYNPDFSQIESDATQIDANQTFALFFPERRPFFLEGADIFDSRINTVYTRSINDPLTAAKITGKSGANTIGVISAMDRTSPYIVPFSERSEFAEGGRTWSNIVRGKRDILTESYVGFLATDRRSLEVGDGSNTTLGADTRIRFWGDYAVSAQLQGSYTVEPDDTSLTSDWDQERFGRKDEYSAAFDGEEFGGYALSTNLRRNASHYEFEAWYDDFSPTFRAETGFVTRNSVRTVGFWNGYLFRLDDNPVAERIQPQVNLGRLFNRSWERIDEWLEPSLWIRFRKQSYVWTSVLYSNEFYAGKWVNRIRYWNAEIGSDAFSFASGGVWWRLGQGVVRDREDPRLGNQRNLNAWLTLKPTAQLQVGFTYNYFYQSEIDTGEEIDDAWVTRLRLTYQFTPRLYLRAIGEYIDWDSRVTVDPLLSYKINPFTVFFLGTSHAWKDFDEDPTTSLSERGYRQTDRVFFVKFQYLFRM